MSYPPDTGSMSSGIDNGISTDECPDTTSSVELSIPSDNVLTDAPDTSPLFTPSTMAEICMAVLTVLTTVSSSMISPASWVGLSSVVGSISSPVVVYQLSTLTLTCRSSSLPLSTPNSTRISESTLSTCGNPRLYLTSHGMSMSMWSRPPSC